MSGSDGPIVKKSFAFAVRIIKLYKSLNERHRDYHLGKQLLRCGTSIGANVRESQNAESRLDFIHKISIALKEASEAVYWLELLNATEYLSHSEFNSMIIDANEIQKILKSIILTCKKKPRTNPST
ncbi:four helix bundle protein [Flavitalea antarctica]